MAALSQRTTISSVAEMDTIHHETGVVILMKTQCRLLNIRITVMKITTMEEQEEITTTMTIRDLRRESTEVRNGEKAHPCQQSSLSLVWRSTETECLSGGKDCGFELLRQIYSR
jgi:hypothetical protein